MKQGNLVERHL